MKSKQFGKRLIVSILLVCYYQQTTATRMIKGSKAENVTVANKQTNQTFELNGKKSAISKTTTIVTNNNTEQDTTTLLADFQVDGRHAFINNQFVAEDEEPLTKTTATPLYNHLQSSSYTTGMAYDQEASPIKEPAVPQKLPPINILGYDIGKFDDYEVEETSDYVSENDSMPENCEDTQESLDDKNEKDVQMHFTQEQAILHEDEPNIYALSQQSKLYDSSNYKAQTNENVIGSYAPTRENFAQNTKLNPGLLYASKPATKPLAQHLYAQADSGNSQQYYFAKPKLTYNYNIPEILQQTEDNYNSLYDKVKFSNSTIEMLSLPGNLNTLNNSFKPNFSYGNSDMQTTSPFSTTSGHNKRFKTVSLSVQYVSTPLADLVFKYSIGMAKHSKSKAAKKSPDHDASISEVRNYINDKTE